MGKVRWNFVHVSRFCGFAKDAGAPLSAVSLSRPPETSDRPIQRLYRVYLRILWHTIVVSFSFVEPRNLFLYSLHFFPAFLLQTSKHRMNCVNFLTLLCLFTHSSFLRICALCSHQSSVFIWTTCWYEWLRKMGFVATIDIYFIYTVCIFLSASLRAFRLAWPLSSGD